MSKAAKMALHHIRAKINNGSLLDHQLLIGLREAERILEDSIQSCNPCQTQKELAVDVSQEQARALHRIVRAMHDGHCPACGHLGPAENFVLGENHKCPCCDFTVTGEQAEAALKLFRPILSKSLDIFKTWVKFPNCQQRQERE